MKTQSARRSSTLLALLALCLGQLQSSHAATSLPDGDIAEGVVRLAKFEITGTRPQATDLTALKFSAKVLETPRSVSIIDATRIREQDFQNADDVLNWVPGMNANAGSYHFIARGFRMGPSDWKVDGFAGRVVGGSYSPNLFGFEQVVALKGPAGLLYGTSSQPGGQVSLISKKPRDTAAVSIDTRIRTFAGSEAGLGEQIGTEVELDATGPVTKDGRLLYRFLSSIENAYERPAFNDGNQFYRLSFTSLLDAAGRYRLTPLVEWSREDRATRGSALSPASSRTVTDGRTDYTFADASPRDLNLAAGARIDDNFTTGFDLSTKFSDAWQANTALRYHDRKYRNNSWAIQTATLAQTNPSDPRSWVVARRHSQAGNDYEDLSLDANTTYSFTPAPSVSSLLQLGFNLSRNETQAYTATNGANQSPINLYTGTAAPLIADASANLPRGNRTETTAWNFYLQSQTKFNDRLTLTFSGGLVGDRTEVFSATGISGGAVKRDSNVTPNAGLVYLLTPKISIYTSYSTSYALPTSSYEDAAGRTGTFAPSEGESIELGAKADLWGDLVAATFAVFDTRLDGVLVQSDLNDLNPNGNRFYRQLDTGRRSRGAELEFTVSPVKGWNTTFTYAYIDAHERSLDGTRAGRAPMTPRHALSLYTRYTFTAGPLQGWSAQAGLLWQSDRIGGQAAISATNPDPLTLRAFHRFDVGLSRQWRGWTVALNIENFTNENYLLGGSTGLNLERANPRSLTFRTGYRW